MQQDEETRYHTRGVIAVDNTLVDHDGQVITDAGWFWDHADDRYKIAYDYLMRFMFAPAISTIHWNSGASKNGNKCKATGEPFQDHTQLLCELVDWVLDREIRGDFAFDSDSTNAEIMNHIHSKTEPSGFLAVMWVISK